MAEEMPESTLLRAPAAQQKSSSLTAPGAYQWGLEGKYGFFRTIQMQHGTTRAASKCSKQFGGSIKR